MPQFADESDLIYWRTPNTTAFRSASHGIRSALFSVTGMSITYAQINKALGSSPPACSTAGSVGGLYTISRFFTVARYFLYNSHAVPRSVLRSEAKRQ